MFNWASLIPALLAIAAGALTNLVLFAATIGEFKGEVRRALQDHDETLKDHEKRIREQEQRRAYTATAGSH